MTFILYYLAILNTLAFAVFWVDKRRAISDRRRVPETMLLLLAFCGGWLGAKLAQRTFRHKTQKQPFRLVLDLVPVAWLGVVLSLLVAANLPETEWTTQAQKSDRETPKFFKSARN